MCDGSFDEAGCLDCGAWVVEWLWWETGHELVASIDRCDKLDICVEVGHRMRMVNIYRGSLPIVEPELD